MSSVRKSDRNTLLFGAGLVLLLATGFGATVAGAQPIVDGWWGSLRPPNCSLVEMVALEPGVHLMFGGYDGRQRLDQVWRYDASASPRWSVYGVSGPFPSPRSGHTMIHDAPRNRVIVFGGYDGFNYLNDTWTLDLSGPPAWTQEVLTGVSPSARIDHSAVFDPANDCIWVFGGSGLTGYLNDLHKLSLSPGLGWTAVDGGSPMPSTRSAHAAVYDPMGQRMLVHGGYRGTYLSDVWSLSLNGTPAWSAPTTMGTPPVARSGHAAAYDGNDQRLVVYGGYDGVNRRSDAWSLSLAGGYRWTPLAPAGGPPPGRSGHAASFDAASDEWLVYGGLGSSGQLGDTWKLGLGASIGWQAMDAPALEPAARNGHAAVVDAARDRLLVFGGYDGVNLKGDLWSLSLHGKDAGTWYELTPADPKPSPRWESELVIDALGEKLYLFGGAEVGAELGDLWEYDLPNDSWRLLTPTGGPPAPRSGSASVSTADLFMLFFGGYSDGALVNDMWGLGGGGPLMWQPLTQTGAVPAPRAGAAVAYDRIATKLWLYGGEDFGNWYDDLRRFDEATGVWEQVQPMGTGPGERRMPGMALNRDQLPVILGGERLTGYARGITRLMSGGGPGPGLLAETWQEVDPLGAEPIGREGHTFVYDAERDQHIVFGGSDGFGNRNDTWFLRWGGSPVAVGAGPKPAALQLAPIAPNPSAGSLSARFALVAPGHATLRIYDLAGREVATLLDAELDAGWHTASWDGRAAEARPPAGIYFVTLAVGGARVSRRIALLP